MVPIVTIVIIIIIFYDVVSSAEATFIYMTLFIYTRSIFVQTMLKAEV